MQRRLSPIFNSFLLFASTSVYALANHDTFELLVFIVLSVGIRSQAVSGSRLKLKNDHRGIL